MASETVYVGKEGAKELYRLIMESIPTVDQALDPTSENAISNKAVTEAIGKLTGFKVSTGTGADNHPDEANPDTRTLYLVKVDDVPGEDKYKEWIYTVDGNWECIGTTSVNMDAYIRKVMNAVEGNLGSLTADGSLADSGISGDAVSEALTKVEGIEEGAQVNVQADWEQTTVDADDYIKNKPTDLVQDAEYVHTDANFTVTEKTKLSSIEEGAEENMIEGISVNGIAVDPDTNKNVNIEIPSAVPDPSAANQSLFSSDGSSWGIASWAFRKVDVPTDE